MDLIKSKWEIEMLMVIRAVPNFPVICLAICFGTFVGCGSGASDGPQRYAVSGTVTFKGEPVPMGFILLTPDSSRGVTGPGAGAPIIDGRYRIERKKGVVGGPHIIEISGTDGIPTTESGEEIPEGKELFAKYKTEFDFAKEDQSHDFEVK